MDLKRGDRRKRVQVGNDAVEKDSFKNFGDEIKIRNRTITREIILGKTVFFQKWSY